MYLMVLIDDKPKWKLVFGRFGVVLILMQDRCIIYTERNIGSEIILDTPDGTPWCCGSCEVSFQSIWRRC
jgi:hypothetical protein